MRQKESQWFLVLWLEQLADGVLFTGLGKKKSKSRGLGREHEFSFGSFEFEVLMGWA